MLSVRRPAFCCPQLLIRLLAVVIVGNADQSIAQPDVSRESTATVEQFLSSHCVACHDDETKSGGLSLDSGLLQASPLNASVRETVVRRLRARQMPPLGEPRPDETSYESVISALEQQLDAYAAAHPNPGRTDTFRRLTRNEYRNAIRDLLDLDVEVSSLLPKDEVSHGFDNVTVGDLSPTLLNRYISAAEYISRLAVGVTATSGGDTIRLRPDITQEDHVTGLPLGTRGGILIPYNFSASGQYHVQVRLMRDRNEHVEGLRSKHTLEILLDRKRVALIPINPPKSDLDHQTADHHLQATFAVSAGPHRLGVTFLKNPSSLIETKRQPYQAHFNFHRHPRLSPAIYEVSVTGPTGSVSVAETPSRRRIFTCRPARSDQAEMCAHRIVASLMRQACRRSVNEDDLELPMQFFREANAEHGFEAGIEAALSSVLVHPQFLFRIERDPPGVSAGTAYRISEFELASRLSFFLWSSLPDERLLQLAEDETLHNPEVLGAEVQRMLADPRSQALVNNFAGQWLYLRNLESLTPDLRLFPDFDHNLRTAFRTETELFFAGIMAEDRSVLDLLSADYTYLNERLAKHYGIPHVYGSRFRRVALGENSQRGGLLRHGSILTVTSYATRTSPVIRGHWIMENILGTPPPPPPDDVPALEDNTVEASLSVRERLTAHRANPACASCHDLMDPVGFALENFDAIGRWRDVEAGRPVDASGGLPDGRTFVGVDGLEQGLLDRPDLFVGTLSEKLLTYALGRGLEYYDAPAVREVVRSASAENFRFSAVIRGIVESTPFQMRMVQ